MLNDKQWDYLARLNWDSVNDMTFVKIYENLPRLAWMSIDRLYGAGTYLGLKNDKSICIFSVESAFPSRDVFDMITHFQPLPPIPNEGDYDGSSS